MLSTGDEVLHGQIVDTNAVWLATTFFEQGFALTFRTTSGDDLSTLVETIHQRSLVADILIVNGGLGPTSDDLTAQAAAQVAKVPLTRHPEAVQHIQDFFTRRGRPMAAINLKQADMPAGAEMLPNGNGTACGFQMLINDCQVFFTPGPPSEFKLMVTEQILPRLATAFPKRQHQICLRLTTFGRGESDIASQLADLECPPGVTLGYRAAVPIVEVKLSGAAQAEAAMLALWQEIKQRLASSLLVEGEQGIAAVIADKMRQRNLTLTTAEGFTAGYLYWQLSSAQAMLSGGHLGQVNNDQEVERWLENARHAARNNVGVLSLMISELRPDQTLVMALVTADRYFYFKLQFLTNQLPLAIRQEIITLQALALLHRWLLQQPVEVMYQSLTIIEQQEGRS